jgi:hypothetical protein
MVDTGCVDCSQRRGSYWDAHALELVMTNTDRLAQALRVYALFAGVYICIHY